MKMLMSVTDLISVRHSEQQHVMQVLIHQIRLLKRGGYGPFPTTTTLHPPSHTPTHPLLHEPYRSRPLGSLWANAAFGNAPEKDDVNRKKNTTAVANSM
ncbi:hypothetical protein INR49_021875 [Caranx melampygus]|nr:hypothetical protein INR49_021875 [Caranx melampygus]